MSSIGIIGAGSMGSGIAQIAATAGHDVLIYEMNPDAVTKAQKKLSKIMARLVEKGKLSPAEAVAIQGRHYFVEQMSSLSSADLVIEAIVERLDVKQEVFRSLEDIVSDDTILATNTSSLSVTRIAAACQHPTRVIGLHFFNPAPLMALVEVVPAIQTADNLAEEMITLMERWGKVPVVTKDTPGFIVNRLARPFYSEAMRILDEGIGDRDTIDRTMTEGFGFRMGPFTLTDYIGHDVNLAVTESMYEAYYHEPRYRPSFSQIRLVDAGYLGRKTGRGYYRYEDGRIIDAKEAVVDNKIGQRILDLLINEAADALHFGVAAAEDLDLAMRRGVNYPKGLLAWAEEIGVEGVVARLDALYERYHEGRYRVSPGLRQRLETGRPFVQRTPSY